MQCEAAAPMHKRAGNLCAFCLAAAISLLVTIACAALLLPEASGYETLEKSGTVIDISHADQGYIMVRQEATDKRLKMKISLGKYSLNYDLNSDGEYEVFPLQLGNGKYKVQIFKQASGKKYSNVSSLSFSVKLESDVLPYLYPNQFVNYGAETLAVSKADELCAGLSTESEKFEAIHAYVLENTTYSYERAGSVESGYLPNIDEVYSSKSGICFDISALMACMLRSQGIPAQLVIGYADKCYHAWNLILLDGEWVRSDVTGEICATEVKRYTTERMY